MKVTVDLKNINLVERIKQIENQRLNGNFIIISGKHCASFSYRNGQFQKARFDETKGKEAMEKIIELKQGFLTIDIAEREKEKEQLWRIIANLPNLLFCGIIEGGIFTKIIIKKETRFSEKEVNNFLNYLFVFSDRQKMKIKEVTLIYDYYLLYIERVSNNIFAVFLLPNIEDIMLLTISIRNITSRIKDVMFSEKGQGFF